MWILKAGYFSVNLCLFRMSYTVNDDLSGSVLFLVSGISIVLSVYHTPGHSWAILWGRSPSEGGGAGETPLWVLLHDEGAATGETDDCRHGPGSQRMDVWGDKNLCQTEESIWQNHSSLAGTVYKVNSGRQWYPLPVLVLFDIMLFLRYLEYSTSEALQ